VKLYIPSLGDHLRLTAPWTFELHHEYRNETMFALQGIELKDGYFDATPPAQVTLPAGSELGIDRIYIRRGAREYDSITFNLLGAKLQDKKRYGTKARVRFWVKLACANQIEFESLLQNIYVKL
jgi:hypothetical protein